MDLAHELTDRQYLCILFIFVSILVLMDLAHESCLTYISLSPIVSILVLMDLAHKFSIVDATLANKKSFNPCFNGSCSRIVSEWREAINHGRFQSLF